MCEQCSAEKARSYYIHRRRDDLAKVNCCASHSQPLVAASLNQHPETLQCAAVFVSCEKARTWKGDFSSEHFSARSERNELVTAKGADISRVAKEHFFLHELLQKDFELFSHNRYAPVATMAPDQKWWCFFKFRGSTNCQRYICYRSKEKNDEKALEMCLSAHRMSYSDKILLNTYIIKMYCILWTTGSR